MHHSGWIGDRRDFLVVNGFARHTPWLHGFMRWFAAGGVLALALLLLLGWYVGRRAGSARQVAAAGWAGVSALVAVAVNQPIVHVVREQRPFVTLRHILVLAAHSPDPGFPSDHATAAGAVAAGLLFVSWRLGALGILTAALVAFSRVYVGVHYPRDVVAGLALGAAIAVAGVVLVLPLLTRLVARMAATPLRPLVADRRRRTSSSRRVSGDASTPAGGG